MREKEEEKKGQVTNMQKIWNLIGALLLLALAFYAGRHIGRAAWWDIYQHPPCSSCGHAINRDPVTHWLVCRNPKCPACGIICSDPPLAGECPECRGYMTTDGRCVNKTCPRYNATPQEAAAVKQQLERLREQRPGAGPEFGPRQ